MRMAFSGHRPEKLPWGSDETDERCRALKQKLGQALDQAIEQGVDTFLCGMARGCDFYFAEAVLSRMQSNPQLSLEGWVPCVSQPDRWNERDKARYDRILRACTRVFLIQQDYSDGVMLRRNRAMVDRADVLLTVWDGGSGGTAATVRYARSRGVSVEGLWL